MNFSIFIILLVPLLLPLQGIPDRIRPCLQSLYQIRCQQVLVELLKIYLLNK